MRLVYIVYMLFLHMKNFNPSLHHLVQTAVISLCVVALLLHSGGHRAIGYMGNGFGGGGGGNSSSGSGGTPGGNCSNCDDPYDPSINISNTSNNYKDWNNNGKYDAGDTINTSGGGGGGGGGSPSGGGTPQQPSVTRFPGRCNYITIDGLSAGKLTLPTRGFHGGDDGNGARISWSARVYRVYSQFMGRGEISGYSASWDNSFNDTKWHNGDGLVLLGPSGQPYAGLYNPRAPNDRSSKKSTVSSPEYLEMPGNAPLGVYTIIARHATTSNMSGYVCQRKFTLIPAVPPKQCSDDIDNDSDGKIDDQTSRRDPGCYVEGRTNDPTLYRPNDDNETNPLPDLKPTLNTLPATVTTGTSIRSSGEVRNMSTLMWAPTNTSQLYARIVGQSCSTNLSSWLGSRPCVRLPNGSTYHIVGTVRGDFDPSQSRSLQSVSIPVSRTGLYEVCLRSDIDGEVAESDEANTACVRFQGVDADTPPPTPSPACSDTIDNDDDDLVDSNDPGCHVDNDPTKPYVPTDNDEYNPPSVVTPPGGGTPGGGVPGVTAPPTDNTLSFSVLPRSVRKGNTSTITWNVGDRQECVITGTNGHSFAALGESTTHTEVTPSIESMTRYTLLCTDDGRQVNETQTINVIARYEEF
jgi:hypothetical protein